MNNWYIKHHNGLDYPNMADGSSFHQQARQTTARLFCTNIQPLLLAGKQASLAGHTASGEQQET